MRRALAVLVTVVVLPACGGGHPETIDLPETWTLDAPGLTVVVTREPYGHVVLDGTGRAVLGPADGPQDEGYAPLSYAMGSTVWRSGGITKGHYSFSAHLAPWHDRWRVVAASEGDRTLTLELEEVGTGTATMRVTYTVRASTLRVEAALEAGTPRAWAAAFSTPSDEAFLGFGERFNRTDQRGVPVFSWAEEGGVGTGEGDLASPANPVPNGQAMTYYPVPFFVSTRGYGFWLDTTWRSQFDLATDRDDAFRAWHLGPTLAYEVYVPIPDDPRPWPYHLVDLFTERTGRPMLPPAWTFGPRRRINRGDVQSGVPEIQAMRDLDLAITGVDDAVHFLPRGSHVGIEDELRAWVTEGHRLGYRMCGYYNSLLADTTDTPLRAEVDRGLANDWFIREQDGRASRVDLISGTFLPVLQIDFTSPEATTWFQGMFGWATVLGYDGFMYDFGEYVQPRSVGSNGMTGEELHNLYPVLYQRAVHDHMEAGPMAGRWLAFARSGYTGASQYVPMVWSGDPAASFEDSDGLPSMVRAAINMGISGVPHWGGDIGGFHCAADGYAAADAELLVRWIQQGSMTPNMQDQDACVFALDDGEKASIWSSPDVMEAWRTYARLHTRLFPYLYALSQTAHRTGAPIVRSMFFEHPDRADLAAVDDSYYLGPSLLVVPVVTRGATERRVSLPEGRYLDWQEPALIGGGGDVTLSAPLAKLPLLLRDGHIVPLLDPTIDTLADETNVDVVGPGDVSHVYDVVGLVSTATGGASFALADGGELDVAVTGSFTAPDLPEATDEALLVDCDPGCWRRDDLGSGLERVRITHGDGTVTAGGLALRTTAGRRIRWDLYVTP